ncbi:TonB-dependent receptor [Pseudomonas kurunegalensis]|nr:TonB-dependent receptor [Pseudomonas kurunegalensis]MDD2136382.1 TonB-dependent receptor [Pseudomonas kurunegalensis]
MVVVTEQQLRERADQDLADVFARTPGVYTQAGNENWGIRGVPVSGFDDQGPATLNGAVPVNYTSETVKSFVGAYYGHNTNNFHDRLLFDDELFGTVKGDTKIENKAVFGEINRTFVPRWALITGLRYDHETNDTDIDQDDFSSAGKVSKSFDAVLPKLGIDYELAADQYLGLMVQKGYRGGGVNVRAGGGHEAYDPEYTTNYELSYRGAFLDKSLRAWANLYYTDWKDQQVSVLDPDTQFAHIFNAGVHQQQP